MTRREEPEKAVETNMWIYVDAKVKQQGVNTVRAVVRPLFFFCAQAKAGQEKNTDKLHDSQQRKNMFLFLYTTYYTQRKGRGRF